MAPPAENTACGGAALYISMGDHHNYGNDRLPEIHHPRKNHCERREHHGMAIQVDDEGMP